MFCATTESGTAGANVLQQHVDDARRVSVTPLTTTPDRCS